MFKEIVLFIIYIFIVCEGSSICEFSPDGIEKQIGRLRFFQKENAFDTIDRSKEIKLFLDVKININTRYLELTIGSDKIQESRETRQFDDDIKPHTQTNGSITWINGTTVEYTSTENGYDINSSGDKFPMFSVPNPIDDTGFEFTADQRLNLTNDQLEIIDKINHLRRKLFSFNIIRYQNSKTVGGDLYTVFEEHNGLNIHHFIEDNGKVRGEYICDGVVQKFIRNDNGQIELNGEYIPFHIWILRN